MLARELRPGRGGLVQSSRNRASAGSAASELAKPMVYTFGRRLVLRLPDTATQRETCWQRPVARAPRRPSRTRPAASLAQARMTASAVAQQLRPAGRSLCTVESAGDHPAAAASWERRLRPIAVPGISGDHARCTGGSRGPATRGSAAWSATHADPVAMARHGCRGRAWLCVLSACRATGTASASCVGLSGPGLCGPGRRPHRRSPRPRASRRREHR